MPCDRVLKPQQTIAERMREVRKATTRIAALLAAKKVKIKIGPQGAVAFIGIPDEVRDGLTDVCIYRRVMASGTHAARQEIAKAEQLSGRSISKQVVGQGVHSHDGGQTWHQKG
jgi:hypothetical protein